MRNAEQFVDEFRRFWRKPSLGGFGVLLDPDVRLVQPMAPVMHGLEEVRRQFQRIFAWLPDLHGEVDRWSASDDFVFIELRLLATLGGKPFEWPLVDRFVLDERGMAIERVSYFDPLPILAAAATRPTGWPRLWQSGAATALLRR